MIFSGIRFVLSSKMSLPVLSCAQQLGISLYSPQQSVGNISTVFPDQQGFAATEDEIEPVSNSPPDFKRSIQGHKRCLTNEDRKRLRQSIDNRHHKTTVANGSIMMCEVQGAKEDFIRRWNLVFKDYPDVFEDNDCRSAILFLIDDTSAYLQTIKERVL